MRVKSRAYALTAAVLLLSLFVSFPLSAAVTTEKTPADVFHQVQRLADDVRELRRQNNITTPWPKVKSEAGREPRHVFQKALEILSKINSYRVNIAKTGGITVPRFPGRDITPNEVYSVVTRLHQELSLLLRHTHKISDIKKAIAARPVENITPSDVYASLSRVSIALEETLGLRGITPSEVYTRSLRVIELVRFLRRSQNLPMNIPRPVRTQGKLPNHALKSVHALLDKIQLAERNLWMKPYTPPTTPRRVITPSDVYDAMGVTIAELQRIQFRLGLEREFPEPEPQKGKTPDDVIQNTVWAAALLPEFELGKPLQQYDRSALKKTPNQVFSITEHILKKLTQYRRLRGIPTPPHKARMIPGLKPQHVYGKALEIMEKVDVLRRRQGLGEMAVPRYLLREITPSEVFDLVLRLDHELALIQQQEGVNVELWGVETRVDEYEDKQPSDVFLNMQRILHLLDAILGSEGSTPNDVYREVLAIKQDVQLIAESLGETIPSSVWTTHDFKPGTEPRDVLAYTKGVLALIIKAKQRAGMFGVRNITVTPAEVVTPTDVFNQVRLIETELTELKVFLGISINPERPPVQKNKTPAHVLQVLEGIAGTLQHVLHIGVQQP